MELLFEPDSFVNEKIGKILIDTEYFLNKLDSLDDDDMKEALIRFRKYNFIDNLNKDGDVAEKCKLLLSMQREFSNLSSRIRGPYGNPRPKDLMNEYEGFLKNNFQMMLELAPKYKVSPIEYYELLVNRKFSRPWRSTLHYANGFVLRFLANGYDHKLVIIPLSDLLEIHLTLGWREKPEDIKDDIKIIKQHGSLIYFQRWYNRFTGIGKDDAATIDKYTFDPNTLQLERLRE